MTVILRIAAVCLAVAAGGWALMRFAWQPLQCNAEISALTSQTDAASRTADDYQRLVRARRNLAALARLREMCPTSVRVPALIGANEEIQGRPDAAERSYRDALSIERRPEIYVSIALVAMQQGRIDDAVENYVAASRFAPYVIEEIMSPEIKKRVQTRLGKQLRPSKVQ